MVRFPLPGRPVEENLVLWIIISDILLGNNLFQLFPYIVKEMWGNTVLLPNEVYMFILWLREEINLEHIKVMEKKGL